MNKSGWYIKHALDVAKRHCDWADIYDMACLVDDIEQSINIDGSLNEYEKCISWILGFRENPPEAIFTESDMYKKAEDAIILWCVLRGYVKKWEEKQTS